MPQFNEQKEQTIEELRKQFDFIPYIYGDESKLAKKDKKKPHNFSGIVKHQIEVMSNVVYLQKVENWGQKCRHARKSAGFTQEQIAALLHVSHVNIVNQESISGFCNVDLFYVEAFSLIYHRTPYELIGRKRKTPCCALIMANTPYDQYQNIIMTTLYSHNWKDNIRHLYAISQIGAMKSNALDKLKEACSSIPNLKEVENLDLSEHEYRNCGEWHNDLTHRFLTREERGSELYQKRYVMMYAWIVTNDLVSQSSPLLKFMAQLAVQEKSVLNLISSIVLEGGIIDDPHSVKQYDVDSFIISE